MLRSKRLLQVRDFERKGEFWRIFRISSYIADNNVRCVFDSLRDYFHIFVARTMPHGFH